MIDGHAPHWADVPQDDDGRPSIHERAAQMSALPVLGAVAQRIADVSPAWQDVTVDPAVAGSSNVRDLPRDRLIGVEAIREGWLLHRRASRLAADASPDLALLIGDWCYAAGLCEIADHGSLDDIAQLAKLVADVSTRCDEPVEQLEDRWTDTTEALHRG